MSKNFKKYAHTERKVIFFRTYALIFIFSLSFLFISTSSEAQEIKQPLKVGVVLSGGGAKGLAHIGVLKVIDSLGIKVSYIGGTSMGAIVGGLYASGYNANQLDSIFSTLNIDALLQDLTPRESKSYYEKRDEEIYAINLPFHKFKLSLPSALSKGFYNYQFISKLLDHVPSNVEFNQLEIPFLCVATDIETGNEVLLENGNLPKAIVASAALPTLFSPVTMGDITLIDGGVANNYPVEAVKSKGVDIIIGVDVQEPLKLKESLKNVTAILAQINNYNMLQKMEKKIEVTDIYIKPEIKNFTVLSFDKGKEIIDSGELATLQQINSLDSLSSNYANLPLQKMVRDSIYIDNISVNEMNNYTRSNILGKLKFKTQNTISYKQFIRGINNLNASNNFETVYYSLEPTAKGYNLLLELTENHVNTSLKFSLHYDGLLKSGLLTNYTTKKFLVRNDVLSLDVVLGDNFRYNFNYYIDNGFHWSFGVNSNWVRFNKNSQTDFSNNAILNNVNQKELNIFYSDFSNSAYVQTIFLKQFSLRIGAELKRLKISSPTILSNQDFIDNSNYLSLYGHLKYDSFDNKFFPKRGWYFFGEAKPYLYSTDVNNNFSAFTTAKADAAYVFSPFKKAAVKLQTEGGFSVGENVIPYLNFNLGGFGYTPINNIKPFFGYDFLSLSGNSYVKASFNFDYEILKKNHINVAANYANIGNKIFDKDTWVSAPKYSGYSVGYGLETFLGPIELKYSWSPEIRKPLVWISVGFIF